MIALLGLAACAGEPARSADPAPAVLSSTPPAPPRACSDDAPDAGDPLEWASARPALATPDRPGDTCAVADSNLTRVEAAILAPRTGAAALTTGAITEASPWDHHRKPARLDDVARRFGLGRDERERLEKNGFVVPARLELATYAEALHEIYQSELPLYVSADAVFHAIFAGNDAVVERLELNVLAPLLRRTLAALHCALPGAAAGYGADVARDLDVYLTVARSLLADAPVSPVIAGDEAEAAALAAKAKAAKGMTVESLFGRARTIDFSAFTPRGHYAADEGQLAPYFRASTWLCRLELNLVSRSSQSSAPGDVPLPAETPREALVALALADLTERSGALGDVRALDHALSVFAGKREDVSIDALLALRRKAGIASLTAPDAFARLKQAVGEGFQRTTRIHYMPQGTTVLPAIATFLGPRIVADATATGLLVEPETPGRHVVSAAEMAYALGHDRARGLLQGEIARYPVLGAKLDEARALAHAPSVGEDLYSAWFQSILALAEAPVGRLPSFMGTDAYLDLRMSSALAAFAQLKHSAVLAAGQPYDQGGCEIPDGFVEPVPAVYDRLVAYAERGAAAIAELDPANRIWARDYFPSVARVLRVLSAISRDELAGAPLREDERQFLSMVLEIRAGTSSRAPTYTGWYLDLFPTRFDAFSSPDLIADYFTSGSAALVSYVGVSLPRMGVFVVDTGGPPRVVVGPVARAYEVHAPLARRLDDASARKLTAVEEPWAASYTAPAPKVPRFEVSYPPRDGTEDAAVLVSEGGDAGKVTVELLDHHRRVLQSVTRSARAGVTRFPFKPPSKERPVEVIHVVRGEAHGWAEIVKGGKVEMGTR
jgi:Protein of unknown function (DUF3160)